VGASTQEHLGASAYGQEHAGPDAPQAPSANLNAATVATADETADEAVAAPAAPAALPSRKRKLAAGTERSTQVPESVHERVVGSLSSSGEHTRPSATRCKNKARPLRHHFRSPPCCLYQDLHHAGLMCWSGLLPLMLPLMLPCVR
jgi:hypothetical protein